MYPSQAASSLRRANCSAVYLTAVNQVWSTSYIPLSYFGGININSITTFTPTQQKSLPWKGKEDGIHTARTVTVGEFFFFLNTQPIWIMKATNFMPPIRFSESLIQEQMSRRGYVNCETANAGKSVQSAQ